MTIISDVITGIVDPHSQYSSQSGERQGGRRRGRRDSVNVDDGGRHAGLIRGLVKGVTSLAQSRSAPPSALYETRRHPQLYYPLVTETGFVSGYDPQIQNNTSKQLEQRLAELERRLSNPEATSPHHIEPGSYCHL